jgi:hypothetical protein
MVARLKSRGSRRAWRDPDDAPEITDKWIAEASLYHGKKLVPQPARIIRARRA